MSANLTHIELKPFVPSKYDLLDMEVQKVLDAVKPGVFIARVDHPLRRGQRKGDGEMWTGEYVFGAGSRSTPVKYVEIGSRVAKRGKCMVKAGGGELTVVAVGVGADFPSMAGPDALP
jgi:hypothetical protein